VTNEGISNSGLLLIPQEGRGEGEGTVALDQPIMRSGVLAQKSKKMCLLERRGGLLWVGGKKRNLHSFASNRNSASNTEGSSKTGSLTDRAKNTGNGGTTPSWKLEMIERRIFGGGRSKKQRVY